MPATITTAGPVVLAGKSAWPEIVTPSADVTFSKVVPEDERVSDAAAGKAAMDAAIIRQGQATLVHEPITPVE